MTNITENEIRSVLNRVRLLEEERVVKTLFMDLPGYIGGFVYYSRRANYYIVINQNLNHISQKNVLYHEAKHIVDHLKEGFFVCELFDGDYSVHECTADFFMEKCYKYMADILT